MALSVSNVSILLAFKTRIRLVDIQHRLAMARLYVIVIDFIIFAIIVNVN